MSLIIGLVGFAGSGKDTVGHMLYEQGFIKESFAAPLKDAVSKIFGWNRGMLEGANSVDRKWREEPDEYWSKKMGKPFSPRMALQLMGTEAGRDVFHPNIWLDAFERRVLTKLENQPDSNFVVTDVRFNNEIKKLNEMGGIIVRVKRGEEPFYYNAAYQYNTGQGIGGKYGIPEELLNIHLSEWDWIGNPLITHEVSNDSTLEDLCHSISQLVDTYWSDRL